MIPIQEARGIFTKVLIESWNELIELAPTSFLRSFFVKKTTAAKQISIEVIRGSERIAVDVVRGTNGNRNNFSKSAEKIIVPPFFNEYLDMTELATYDRVFASAASNVTANDVSSLIDDVLQKLQTLRHKIERRYELQCSQVFESGIVTLEAGDNIDFKRKSASQVVKDPSEYWSVDSVDPRVHIKDGCKFLRQIGKATGGIFNAIMGETALNDFLSNPFIINDKIKDIALIDLKSPQVDAQGGVYHGQISCGPYKVNLWSYPEFYEEMVNGTLTPIPYINADYVYLLPVTGGVFRMSFAGVPAIIRDTRNSEFPELIGQVEADYFINNYVDKFKKKHVCEVLSAGVPVPVSIDRIYSMKVTDTEIQGG